MVDRDPFLDALDRFSAAAVTLSNTWSQTDHDASNYPAHWESFDEEVIGICSWLVSENDAAKQRRRHRRLMSHMPDPAGRWHDVATLRAYIERTPLTAEEQRYYDEFLAAAVESAAGRTK